MREAHFGKLADLVSAAIRIGNIRGPTHCDHSPSRTQAQVGIMGRGSVQVCLPPPQPGPSRKSCLTSIGGAMRLNGASARGDMSSPPRPAPLADLQARAISPSVKSHGTLCLSRDRISRRKPGRGCRACSRAGATAGKGCGVSTAWIARPGRLRRLALFCSEPTAVPSAPERSCVAALSGIWENCGRGTFPSFSF